MYPEHYINLRDDFVNHKVPTQFEDPGIRGKIGGKDTKPSLMTVDL